MNFFKNINKNNNVFSNLITVYGINRTRALFICKEVGIFPITKWRQLSDFQIKSISSWLDINISTILDASLKEKQKIAINHLKKAKSYRGLQHSLSLPCRGQRTQTNAKTAKKLNRLKI